MYRRNARERREFIYKKSIEDREKAKQGKKDAIRKATEDMKPIPTDLRKEAVNIHGTLDWDDKGGEEISPDLDNEYRWVGVEDPKIFVTTSRDPSSRLRQFAKEMKLLFPNSQRINRGGYDLNNMMKALRAVEATDLIILSETRGNPDGMQICHLPHGPTAYFTLSNAILRHDIPNVGTMSEEYPCLISYGLTSVLGKRVLQILAALFPPLKDGSKRVISFSSLDGCIIQFRHHTMKTVEGKIEPKEVGPRFDMKLYKIIRDTLESEETADVEYQLKPHMRTAKYRVPLWDEMHSNHNNN